MNKQLLIKSTWLLLVLLIIVSSCKKGGGDTAPPPNNDTNHPLITRYEYAPNLYTLFSYNAAGKVTGITDINDIARSDFTVTYKTDGKIDKLIQGNGFWKFTYNSNLLEQADAYYNNNPVSQGYYKFVYDGQKVMQSLFYTNYGTSVIEPRSKIAFQYNANGDIIRSDVYLWNLTTGNYDNAGYQLYESDTHTNPVYWMHDIFMVLYNVRGPRNYTKAEFFNSDGSVHANFTYDFKYNNSGYPVSAIRKNLAASTNAFGTLKFVYK